MPFTGSYTVEPSREDCLIATDGPLDHERHPMGGMRAHEQVEPDQPYHWRWV